MPPTGDLLRKVYQNSQQPVLENNLHQRRRLLLWSGNKRQEFRQDYNPFLSHRHRRHWASTGAEGAGCSCKASHASPAVFSVCGMWKVSGKQASATQGQSRPGYNPSREPSFSAFNIFAVCVVGDVQAVPLQPEDQFIQTTPFHPQGQRLYPQRSLQSPEF